MKFIKAVVIQILLISFANCSYASTLIQALSGCNSYFFNKALKTDELSGVINDFYKHGISEGEYKKYINLSDSGIELNNFTVTYTNFDKFGKNIPNTPTGKYYFWGFESKQSINNVVDALSGKMNLIKISNDSYIYNPEYRNTLNDDWSENKSPLGGVAPDENSAEKLFILEGQKDGSTTIYCSIQGMLIDNDLRNTGLIK